MEPIILRCKSSTDSHKLAGSIFSACTKNEGADIFIRLVGAGALNQAVKAVIISNDFFYRKGIRADIRPEFQTLEDGITAIMLQVVPLKIQKVSLI